MALPINIEDLLRKQRIETDESRTYFLIDIPARMDFVQDANKIKDTDIKRVRVNMSKMCPRYVHERIGESCYLFA